MNKPKRPCRHYGCPNLVDKGFCPEHAKKHNREYDRQRGTAHERGYDADWQKFREYYLRKHPVCKMCKRAATLIHHKTPLSQGGNKYDNNNLMSLCTSCHVKI
ncbi:MAG: HNH endonuclease, partial [Aliifodinibius sp.]|nr:HNH endonuclease [Fodinibius sp.]NIV10841.1 HNH endonuclease [Fodinibius sp.]NIY24438.1 HNH endonuclease [Fodinibius sp.]